MLRAILISLVAIILCFGLMDAIWLGFIAPVAVLVFAKQRKRL